MVGPIVTRKSFVNSMSGQIFELFELHDEKPGKKAQTHPVSDPRFFVPRRLNIRAGLCFRFVHRGGGPTAFAWCEVLSDTGEHFYPIVVRIVMFRVKSIDQSAMESDA